MRTISEIDRDFFGMHDKCERQNHGCTYPSCACPRTPEDVPQRVTEEQMAAAASKVKPQKVDDSGNAV